MTSCTSGCTDIGYSSQVLAETYPRQISNSLEEVYSNNEIKTTIVLDFSNEQVKTLHESKLKIAFAYYKYSMTVSVILTLVGMGMFVLYILGFESQLFVSIWLSLIGIGMSRTLYLAGNERFATDEVKRNK